MSTPIENNTEELRNILQQVNELPDSGGGYSVEILLPSEAVAVVGVEFNIYHKSVFRCNGDLSNIDIGWAISGTGVSLTQLAECLRITATDSNVGNYTLTAKARDIKTGTVIAEKSMLLRIIANTALTGRNVLFIGDSLTYSRGGLYAAEIQHNLSGGGMVSIGTQNGASANNQIGDVKHEGYNGATVGGFLSENVVSGYANPFYNPNTGAFDIAYFMTNNGFSHVDAVCLNLGHNNIGNHANAVSGLQTMIAKIHEYDANIPVIISLITPVAGQDAWRNKSFTAAQMRTHWRNLLVAYMDAFDNGKISNVYLSTPYFNIDPDNDFETETVARAARDDTEIVRQNDPMHPSRIGTLKMADVYFAYLLNVLPEGDEPDEPTVNYTNWADPSKANDAAPNTALTADEWLNGYCISGKKMSEKDNIIVTNKIPFTYADTIRIKGFTTTGNISGGTCSGFLRVLPCDANGTALATEVKPAQNSEQAGNMGWVDFVDANDLANGIYTFKPSEITYGTLWKNVAFVRVSGYPIDGNNANVIVTVNEPIE